MSSISAPTNENGEPLVFVYSSSEETIPTAPYANVKLAQSLGRWVSAEDYSKALAENFELVDKALQVERDKVLEELDE